MAGVVVNVKVCSPLKQSSVLTGYYNAICHYSYNFPLYATRAHFHQKTRLKGNNEAKPVKPLEQEK